jgi:hypothetical protein
MTRSLSEVFFERVIRIETVQRERAEVAEKGAFVRPKRPRLPKNASEIERARHQVFYGRFVPYTAESFFEYGCIPGTDSALWLVANQMRAFRLIRPFPDHEGATITPAMQNAWNAALYAWALFCDDLLEGRLIVAGFDHRTGEPGAIEPHRWHIAGLWVDVHASIIYQTKSHGRWIESELIKQVEGATVVEAEDPVYVFEPGERPHIVWGDWWRHECDRRDRGLLLQNPDDYLDDAEQRIKARYQVNVVNRDELSRCKTALYAGETVRPTSTARKNRI